MRHINDNERLELDSVDEVEDKLHDVKIKPTIQATQSTEKIINNERSKQCIFCKYHCFDLSFIE